MLRFLAVVATLVLASCSDSTAPRSDILRINILPDALELMNTSQKPVYAFIAERNSLALLDWAPCMDPSCESVAVGGSMVVPYEDITGYTTGAAEAVVYHWHLVPDGADGFRPDSIRATIIALHVDH